MSTDHMQAWFAKAWSARQTQRPVRHIPVVEEYEPRLLYSADPITAGLALAGPGQVVEQRLVDDAGEFVSSSSTSLQAQERRRELLIVGAGIEDSKTLLDGLESDDREIEVLVLDPSRDSIDQISAALAGRHDLAAIHILSHGANGQLQLGATTLDSAQLTARADEISRWGQALQADGDILLYGCDVAADASGAAFVHQLSALTGADIAASDDLTGDNLLQGDWTLEYTTGAIETALAVNASVQRQWTGVLEARVNTTTAGGQSNAAVAIAPDGSFVVTWASGGGLDGEDSGIFLQRYDAVGNRLGTEVQVNTDFAEEQISPSVGMDANGGFVVTWASDSRNGADDDGWSIRAQRFNADGSKAGVEFVVNKGTKGDQDQPVVSVAADGQFVIAWRSDASSGSDIYVRHFDANGAALRSDVLVVNSDGSQGNPAIAINSDGSYVVAWQSNKGGSGKSIFAQRFDSDDSRLGAEFRVNTYDINDQTRPTVATDGNGAFVIAWTSTDQDGSGDGVYAQLFASDGTKAGSEFRVNTYTNNDQDLPAAAMDGNGSFIISWSSRKQDDPASTGIYAQRYSPDGAATGAPVLVNSTVARSQDSPAVAMNSRGDTVIAWDGNGAADRSGIFMAAYVAANVAPSAKLDIVITDQITSVNSTAPGVLANDIDPEGSPLVVQGILAGATGAPVAVTAAGVTITGAYGKLFIRSDGSYVYTPNSTTARGLAAGQSADDLFTYVISDDKNASASSTLTFVVQGVNDAPVANDNIYVVDKLGTLNVAARGVLANDTDPDVAPVPDVLTVSAINDMSNKVGVALYGSYGTLTLRADGSLHYAPDLLNVLVLGLLSGQQLVDAFSYSISDGNGGIARAMVKINIVSPNSAPAATDDSGYVVQEDGVLAVPVAGGVLANDTDLDGNALSAVLASGPAHGRLVFNQDGSFVYTPDPLYHGADSFTYRASDGSLNSSLATVFLTVTHVNHAPVVQDDDAFIMQDNVLLVSAANGLLANDTEPDASDTLAITGIRVGNTFSPVVAGSPTIIVTDYGTLEVASDGSYSYISDGAASKSLGAGSISNDVFTYTVSDGQGGTATAKLAIRITGSNDAPAVSGVVANQSTDDKASTTPFSNLIIGDVDSPSQTLTVTITLDLPAKGMLSNLSGGTYDAATGVFSFTGSAVKVTAAVRGLIFTPTENRVAPGLTETTALAITVNDGIAATTDVTTTVVTTSINDAPGISGAVAVHAVADKAMLNPFSTVTFGDADNPSQSLTVRITIDATVKGKLSNLGGGAYDYATGTYSFTGSAAQATAVVRALVFTPTENRVTPGSSETAAFAITVKDGVAETDVRITVVSTSINDAPNISGTVAGQPVADNAVLNPFSSVTFGDADSAAQTLTVSIALDTPAKGTLSNLAGGTYHVATGIYSFTGTAVQATAAVRGLAFTPTENRVAPGATEHTTFTITVSDGLSTTSDMTTTAVSTSVNDAPVAFLARASGVQDAAHPVAITLIGTDVDGTVGSFRVTSLPTTGTLYRDGAATTPVVAGAAISANGNKLTLYYKPAAGWIGDASFTYTARDDLGLDSASHAVVNLTVQPFVAEPAPVPVEAAPVPVATVPAVIVVSPASPMPASAAASVPAPVGARPTDMDGVPGAPDELGTVVTADFGQATTVTSTDVAPARTGLRIIAPGMIAPQDANAIEIASIPVATSMANFWRGLSDVLGSSGGATAAPASLTMVSGLDEFRDSIRTSEVREQQAVGISVAAGTSVSAGYVIWLLRGGVLATSLMSSLPAWRFVDPLPVLNRLGRDDDDDEHDDDSLEAMVGTDPDEPEAEEDIRTPR